MGSYAYLNVSGYELLSTKGSPEPIALTLFDENDRREHLFYEGEDSVRINESRVAINYVSTVSCIRDRLETMGFTIERSRAAFAAGIESQLRNLEEPGDAVDEGWNKRINLLRRITFDDWLNAFRVLKSAKLHAWNYKGIGAEWTGIDEDMVAGIIDRDPDLFDYMLDRDEEFLGFHVSDFRVLLRAALEVCADDEELEYDIAELIANGYLPSENVATDARDQLLADFPSNAPIIVAMEGTTDIAAVESAMRVLAPHLRSYYSFVDFAAASARGGATALMEMVKAFIAARVANRVIAIFDNDAVGRDTARLLSNLPANIRVVLLPPINLANSYPTLGPSGASATDVNGRAASIELYFGEDVLRDGQAADLMPIRWSGFVGGVAEYQGELADKRELQRRYVAKVDRALNDPEARKSQDWSGMTAVIDAIRTAFV